MGKRTILFIYPNVTNITWICSAMPILMGIAKKHNFEYSYFDTHEYKKEVSSFDDKENMGGFKKGYGEIFKESLPYENIIIDLQEKIDNNDFDLIVISVLSIEYDFFIKFWNQIKVKPKTKIIIGGIHAILDGKKVASTNMFDLVCTGQAETIFPEILNRIESDANINDIAGTYYVNRTENIIIRNKNPKLLPSNELWLLDSDFSIFDEKYYLRPFDNNIIRRYDIEISRGCPYNCNYCGNSALKSVFLEDNKHNFLTLRPIDSIFSLIKKMMNENNIDIFQIMDECFLAHPIKWIEEFMTRYSKECGKRFIFQTRPETISEEKIKLISSFNIPYQVSIGVESGSVEILRICNRKYKIEQVIDAFDILHKYNVRTNAFFMIGLPYETRDDYFKTVELCRRIKPTVLSVGIFQPMVGQQLTDVCINNGFMDENTTIKSFTEGSLLYMPKPYLSNQEIKNLWRTFVLYSTLPEEYMDDIKKCEIDYENNKELFEQLIKLRWKLS